MPLPNIEELGQKALAAPTEILGVESRHIQEKMDIFSQGLGNILPAGADMSGLALPQLPDIFAGRGTPAPLTVQPLQGASTKIQGQAARVGKLRAHMEV